MLKVVTADLNMNSRSKSEATHSKWYAGKLFTSPKRKR